MNPTSSVYAVSNNSRTTFRVFTLGLVGVQLCLLHALLFASPALAANSVKPPANAPSNTPKNSLAVPTYQTPPIEYKGPESSIKKYLCTPTESTAPVKTDSNGAALQNPDANNLKDCVNRLYRFGAAVGAFAGVFFVALAGY